MRILAFFSALIAVLLPTVASADRYQFRVGVSIPLTSVGDEYGAATRNGIELARAQMPEKFEQIKFFYEDSMYDGKQSLAGMRKLISADDIDLLYVFGSVPSEAIVPIAEQKNIPTLVNCVNAGVTRGKNYAMRFNAPAAQYSKLGVDYLTINRLQKVASVITNSAYCNELHETLKDQIPQTSSLMSVARVEPGDSDFKSIITKIRSGNFDALYLCLFPGQAGTFFRQAAALGLSLPVLGTEVLESSNEIAAAGAAAIGAVYAYNTVDQNFRLQYVSRFGDDVQISTAANGYDLALLVAQHFSALKTRPTREDVIGRIMASKPYVGASGTVAYREDLNYGRQFDFPVQLKRVTETGRITGLKISRTEVRNPKSDE